MLTPTTIINVDVESAAERRNAFQSPLPIPIHGDFENAAVMEELQSARSGPEIHSIINNLAKSSGHNGQGYTMNRVLKVLKIHSLVDSNHPPYGQMSTDKQWTTLLSKVQNKQCACWIPANHPIICKVSSQLKPTNELLSVLLLEENLFSSVVRPHISF